MSWSPLSLASRPDPDCRLLRPRRPRVPTVAALRIVGERPRARGAARRVVRRRLRMSALTVPFGRLEFDAACAIACSGGSSPPRAASGSPSPWPSRRGCTRARCTRRTGRRMGRRMPRRTTMPRTARTRGRRPAPASAAAAPRWPSRRRRPRHSSRRSPWRMPSASRPHPSSADAPPSSSTRARPRSALPLTPPDVSRAALVGRRLARTPRRRVDRPTV